MFAGDISKSTPLRPAGRLLVVVATYNERENLPDLVERILSAAPAATVLVIDDNSPDGTGEWARERARSEPRLQVRQRPGKQGLGTAILEAMRVAVAENYDWLVNLDADFSHDPDVVPALVAATVDAQDQPVADVVIGSRYIAGGGTSGWPWYRRWTSRSLNGFARRWLRLPLRDCSSGYRCFRTEILRRLDFGQVWATGYAFHEELLWHLRRHGARFRETPILFVDRRQGRSKINLREGLAALAVIARLGLAERLGRSPAPKPA